MVKLFKNPQSTEDDYGLKAFSLFVEILKKYKKITTFELKNSEFIQQIMRFLLGDTVEIFENENRMEIEGEEIEEEEKKALEEQFDEEKKLKKEPSLIEAQVSAIIRRLFVFCNVFARNSPLNHSSKKS